MLPTCHGLIHVSAHQFPEPLENLHEARRVSMYQGSNSFGSIVLDSKSSTPRRDQEVDEVFSIAVLRYCALDGKDIVRNDFSMAGSPLATTLGLKDVSKDIPSFVGRRLLVRGIRDYQYSGF